MLIMFKINYQMLQYYLKEKIINSESTASSIADLNGDGKVTLC